MFVCVRLFVSLKTKEKMFRRASGEECGPAIAVGERSLTTAAAIKLPSRVPFGGLNSAGLLFGSLSRRPLRMTYLYHRKNTKRF